MSNATLTIHVLTSAGSDTYELAAHDAEHHPWHDDGQTAHPGEQCRAVAHYRGAQCQKEGVVEILTKLPDGMPSATYPVYMGVCGGHWLAHARGKALELVA